MVKIDIEEYIDELRGSATERKELDLYSLKKELVDLNESSKVFDEFEKNAMAIDKEVLHQVQDLSLLIKIKNLASEIKDKNKINDKLHILHFNLNLLKNNSANNIKSLSNMLNAFLYNNETRIDSVINELNDFKIKLDKIKKSHPKLLPKSLDNKLEVEDMYNKHIEQLYSIHKRQKDAFISTIKLFLQLTKKHMRNLQKFK